MGTYQLAFVSCQPVRAGGADLAVVVDWQIFGSLEADAANRAILRKIGHNFAIEDVGSVGEHG
jgi:hypothetical protein